MTKSAKQNDTYFAFGVEIVVAERSGELLEAHFTIGRREIASSKTIDNPHIVADFDAKGELVQLHVFEPINLHDLRPLTQSVLINQFVYKTCPCGFWKKNELWNEED